MVRWIEAFLTNRTQKVKINGVHSNIKPVLSGIPQGSVLGPILFAIFINDLPEVTNNLSNMYLFADDAKMYKTIKSDVDAKILNDCYQNMMSWSDKWCMKLNIDKCKVLSLAKHSNTIKKYDYNGVLQGDVVCKLEHVSVIKDLGVNVDEVLNFKEHINEKINKAYQMLGIINRNFSDLDSKSFVLIYKAMVRSL